MIVITGASDGLGLQLAKLYQEAGKNVANISRHDSKYADVNIILSLREDSEIEKAANEVAKIEESIEAIIYCAGVLSVQPLGEITEEEVKRLMATNVKSQILLTSKLVDRIKKDKTDIVCVSSTVGTKGYVDQASMGHRNGLYEALRPTYKLSLRTCQTVLSVFAPVALNLSCLKRLPATIIQPVRVSGCGQKM